MLGKTNLFVLVMAFATGLALISFVSPAFAIHSSGVEHNAYVLAVDPVSQSLDVRLYERAISSDTQVKGETTLNTNEMTEVIMCNESRSFEDIKEGDTLAIMFHDVNGEAFADSIAISASLFEERC